MVNAGPHHALTQRLLVPASARAVFCVLLIAAVCPACAQNVLSAPRGLLARPLPGTVAREDADLCVSLESALATFSDVSAARAVLSRTADTSTRRLALQLTLNDQHQPTQEWTDAIAAFTVQAVPHLSSTELTIVTADGRVLYARGQAAIQTAQVSPAAAQASPATSPWMPIGVALVVGLIGTVVALLLRQPRRLPETPAPQGPLSFLHDISDQELAGILEGEREAVVAIVLADLPQRRSQRIRRSLGLTAGVAAQAAPGIDVLEPMASALRAKLTRTGPR